MHGAQGFVVEADLIGEVFRLRPAVGDAERDELPHQADLVRRQDRLFGDLEARQGGNRADRLHAVEIRGDEDIGLVPRRLGDGGNGGVGDGTAQKGGFAHGATDDYGFYAERDKMHIHDVHATLLHLLGIDHEKLTYRHAGRDFRLTDVFGHVAHEILA